MAGMSVTRKLAYEKMDTVKLGWISMPEGSPRPVVLVNDDQWRQIILGLPEIERVVPTYHGLRGQLAVPVPCLRAEDA